MPAYGVKMLQDPHPETFNSKGVLNEFVYSESIGDESKQTVNI
jgi:hypothetical protein